MADIAEAEMQTKKKAFGTFNNPQVFHMASGEQIR